MQIIKVDESRCIGCNACIRVCPVHANITRLKEGTTDEFVTSIDPNACINCGECVKVCKHGARDYNDHFPEFKKAFESKQEMILIVAPAIRTSYPDGAWKVLLSWLRENGNCRIYDVGFGADICTYMYERYIQEHGSDCKLITQPCPAVVNFIQKYHPELIPYLSPVLSPVGCLAVWLKKYKNEKAPMFMLSPCIAKTSEAGRENLYDYNVTFRNLDNYINKSDIDWAAPAEFEFDALEGSIGRMYPMPSGLKETLLMLNPNLVIRNMEGVRELYPGLERYAQTEDSRKPDVLDVLNCRHGCNRGTALPEDDTSLLEVEQIMTDITAASVRETKGGLFGIGKFKRFKEFDKTLHLEDFLTTYKNESIQRPKLTSEEYTKVYHHMHKYDLISQNINCGACGYRHCRDMAYAIHYKLNVRENCVYYLKQSLKDKYTQLKDVYQACLQEITNISQVSQEIKNHQQEILTNSEDIYHKADTMSDNSDRLQEITEILQELTQVLEDRHNGKLPEQLTSADFQKLQSLITEIHTMAESYAVASRDFEVNSESIHDQIQTMSHSLISLNSLSENLEKTMKNEEI